MPPAVSNHTLTMVWRRTRERGQGGDVSRRSAAGSCTWSYRLRGRVRDRGGAGERPPGRFGQPLTGFPDRSRSAATTATEVARIMADTARTCAWHGTHALASARRSSAWVPWPRSQDT